MDVKKEDFFKASNLRARGHKLKICKRRAMKFARRMTFSNRVIDDWNALPSDIIEAESVNNFKTRLDIHWKDDMYKNNF